MMTNKGIAQQRRIQAGQQDVEADGLADNRYRGRDARWELLEGVVEEQ